MECPAVPSVVHALPGAQEKQTNGGIRLFDSKLTVPSDQHNNNNAMH